MEDWAEKNRAHFNEAASTYNSKFSKTILQIIEEIQARRDWIGVGWVDDSSESDDDNDGDQPSSSSASNSAAKTVRLLDYACGTGLVSRALAPYVTQSIGIDISESMANEYNAGARNQGIPESEMRAVIGNLISQDADPSPSVSGPEFHNFDIAAVGLGFHHFASPALAAKRLAERLKPGGVLLIIDFLPHGHDHSLDHEEMKKRGVTHMGFSEEDVKGLFEGAGVGGEFEYVVVGKGIVFKKDGGDMKREVFMAKGRKS